MLSFLKRAKYIIQKTYNNDIRSHNKSNNVRNNYILSSQRNLQLAWDSETITASFL